MFKYHRAIISQIGLTSKPIEKSKIEGTNEWDKYLFFLILSLKLVVLDGQENIKLPKQLQW